MDDGNRFFRAIGIDPGDRQALNKLSRATGVAIDRLRAYDRNNILPSGADLDQILRYAGVSELVLRLRMGLLDRRLTTLMAERAEEIAQIVEQIEKPAARRSTDPILRYESEYGQLYQADCRDLMESMPSESVDVVFADPPFNLSKSYPSGIDDAVSEADYLTWCETWIDECARILKHGGSLFHWNLPKWNGALTGLLQSRLNFRHWIAVDIKYSLPISNRLYPSHYSLVYFVKGEKPNTFEPDRLPMEVCPECAADLKDYGGYKNKMNPRGVNLTDVWYDIPPVRHRKYKGRNGANELSIKVLDRVIEMSSKEGDLVFDPFGGAGTTYIVSELKKRRWIGVEIGPTDDIVRRFENLDAERTYLNEIRSKYNRLFSGETMRIRKNRGLWTHETFLEYPAPDAGQLRFLESEQKYPEE